MDWKNMSTALRRAFQAAGKAGTVAKWLDLVGFPPTTSVASQVAMLALTDHVGQRAIRTDQSGEVWMQKASPASVLGNWEVTTASLASEITNTPAGSIAATTVQAAINELDGDVTGHTGDAVGAHAASAIAVTPAGTIAAIEVQAAIVELDGDIQGHITDATAAHAASAIAVTPAGTIAATTAQAALEEIAADAAAALAATIANAGGVAGAVLLMANQPADGDTIGIGADVYEFVDTAVNTVVNDDAHIAVVIGALAANTRTNLIAAINAAGTAGATVTLADTVTPALEDGTEAFLADEVGTTVRIRSATAAGGTVVAADPNKALAESITDVADVWNVGNVNLNTLNGKAAGASSEGRVDVTVVAAMITNGYRVEFPFAVAGFIVQPRSSAGVIRANGTDTFVASGNSVVCTFGGGAAPDVQATDVLQVVAWS